MRALYAPLAAALAMTAVACSDAPANVTGGDLRFDAAPPIVPTVNNRCNKSGGTTWTAIYNDCFGPDRGHCGNAGCHATNADPGSLAVGFTCGSTKDSCWMGVQAPGSIVPNGGTQTPESTKLYIYIRKSPPDMSGTMPQNSDFALEADDLARLKTWIMAGAKND